MMDHALGHGWDDEVGGFFEAAPGSAPAQLGAHDLVVRRKPWWVQTEALIALLSLDDLDGGHAGYRRYFEAQWRYVRRHLIDGRHGGIYTIGLDALPRWRGAGLAPPSFTRKGSVWKDSSHDGRAWLSCIAVLRGRARGSADG